MASSSTPQGTLRQRNVPGSSKKKDGASSDSDLDTIIKAKTVSAKKDAQRDYQITGILITALAFLTRFWGISHPNEVVFDEVHFGKVSFFCSRLSPWLHPN